MTNKTINIYRKSVDWQGKKTTTLLDSYDVWIEESEVTRFMPNKSGEVVVGRGLIFLFDQVSDINNCIIELDGNNVDVVGVDTFLDDDGTFHHSEITYR